MRIISGKHRGTKLFTLEGLNTRPTLDRVKEALFNILQVELQDATILDLFSGSGALAIESLSRGAKKAYLCDNSRDAIAIINKNISKTHTEENTVVLNKSYEKALLEFKKLNIKFDVIFLDPPYLSDFAEDATSKIIEYGLLTKDGLIVIETDDKEKVIKNLNNSMSQIYDERNYGRVCLLFLKRKE